ncbi:hypothetical protein ACH49M_30530 [Rhodococcus qingshengii]|jgi:outer membrane murein-binding lipoprotein Lpp|uniref:Lipoprotein n=1 Tax=Rhodococcus baikonurensis TaxID=172041 RepID=A0ABV5XRD3_9NOCA|nr:MULTISPECIES: hypothetical protein [Rhodococcus]EEN86011.1 hypothetical protein RHOER0001_4608 [Rhodococcus erythropolis SK121]MBP1054907.1 hypothetical protein [Rhodococcus qingshengii]MBW0282488.1 hypothetical protein [Rhodococcus sp. FH8]
MNTVTKISIIACTAASLALTGCSSDDTEQSAPTTTTTTANTTTNSQPTSTTTSSSTTTALTTGNRANSPTDNKPPQIGDTQHATGQGFTADLAILTPSFTTTKSGNKALTFPVVIDVTTGKLNAQPSYWKVTTQSGQTIKGNYSTGIPTAIGDADLDGHIEGLIPFADSNLLTNPDVAISKITLYTSFGYNTEIASWTFPTAIAVTDIPTK